MIISLTDEPGNECSAAVPLPMGQLQLKSVRSAFHSLSVKNMSSQRPANVAAADWNALQSELGKFKDTATMTPQQLAEATPEQLGNSQEMEQDWAIKAFRHAEVYEKLISAVDNHATLRLTKIDDGIYAHFRREFPSLAVNSLTEDQLKSDSAKLVWRRFCSEYNDQIVKDFNFGTLLRLNCAEGYSQDNSTFGAPCVSRA